jgi:hypothetical protein
MDEARTYAAFGGTSLIASGDLPALLPQLKTWTERAAGEVPLIFDDATGRQVDFDLRGSVAEILARSVPGRGPGRPKLGVVPREISLLPRHWEWLEQQPNGASAALRRLVDDARKHEPDRQRARRAQEAATRVMSAIAGNLPSYEEATRALYAGDRGRFGQLIAEWPPDIRGYVARLAEPAFEPVAAVSS